MSQSHRLPDGWDELVMISSVCAHEKSLVFTHDTCIDLLIQPGIAWHALESSTICIHPYCLFPLMDIALYDLPSGNLT